MVYYIMLIGASADTRHPNFGLDFSTRAPGMNLLAQYGTSGKIATLQNQGSGGMPTPKLPPWLDTDPDSLLDEIMAEYNGAGKVSNAPGVARGYEDSINSAMGMGGQIADNAMREAMARSGQSGGDINSAMVKAQAMLPVYEHTAGLRKDKALAVADIKSREAGMRASLAQAIGSMRTSYLSMLSQSYFQAQGQSNQWANQQRQFGLQEDEFDLRKELARRAGGGDGGGGAGGRAAGDASMEDFYPGYLPNSGPITSPARIGSRSLPNTTYNAFPSNWLR